MQKTVRSQLGKIKIEWVWNKKEDKESKKRRMYDGLQGN